MASRKLYADTLKNAAKPREQQTQQAPSTTVKKNKTPSKTALGPTPSPCPPSAPLPWAGRSWASVLKGKREPSSLPANDAAAVAATPKPRPRPMPLPSTSQQAAAPALTDPTADMSMITPSRRAPGPSKIKQTLKIHTSPSKSTGGLSSPLSPSSTPTSSHSQSPTVSSAQHAPFAHLWLNPLDADVRIVCQGATWLVHRHILVSMSEWMEKHMPNPRANGSNPVLWNLDTWNPGVLSAVLRYTYLEEYPGGEYSSRDPLDTKPVAAAVAHFLAGAACLHRPLMEHTLRQIEQTASKIQSLTPLLLRHLQDFDDFSNGLRVAMAMTYDEPDQWRVRALRVVIGKLMAVAFPLILQSPRWGTKYCAEWGPLRARVVADHLWLTDNVQQAPKRQGGEPDAVEMERNERILVGYEDAHILWKEYRGQDWEPAADLLFPERGGDDPADLWPLPPPPCLYSLRPPPLPQGDTKVDDGRGRARKRSKAIPIMRPDGTSITLPAHDNHEPGLLPDKPPTNGQRESDGMGPSAQPVSSSRAQSWPRGPRPDPVTPSSPLKAFACRASSPLKSAITYTSTSTTTANFPFEEAAGIDTRRNGPPDDHRLPRPTVNTSVQSDAERKDIASLEPLGRDEAGFGAVLTEAH